MPAAGWYPDPYDRSRQRYFDGKAWTENYAPLPPPPPGTVQPSKNGISRNLKIGLGVAAGVLVLVVLGSIANNDRREASSSTSETATRTSSAASPSAARTAVAAPTTTEPPKPRFTRAQQNAIAKAESYLDYSAFSKQGLINQLEFDDFSTADAVFAVQHLEANGEVDWNDQALKKAESYLDYTSFSLPALVNQLEFDGFTPSEAQYGANTAYAG